MKRNVALLLLLLIVVGAVGLRAWQLTARSLWFDEAFSWRLIQFPVDEMIARDAADVHPPLYYLLLKGWAWVFGSSLLSLRSFSVALGAATVALGYLFTATAWKSRPAGLMAALLLAVSGYQIQFSWEARMYTLGTALALLSAWLLIRASRRPTMLSWAAYGLSAAALIYTHYYALFTLAAEAVFILGYLLVATRGRVGEILQSRLFWYAVLSGAVIVTCFAPWLPTFIAQNGQVQSSFWIPPTTRWSLPDTFYRLFLPTTGTPRHEGGRVILTLLPLVLVLALWIWLAVRRKFNDAGWLAALLGLVPFVVSIALSLLTRSIYQDRYFLFAQVFILCGFAAFIAAVPWRTWRRGLLAFLVALSLGSYLNYWRDLNVAGKPGARAAASAVYAASPSEPVVVSSSFVYFAILHYAQEEFHSGNLPRLYSETGELSHFSGGPILKQSDVVGPAVFKDAKKIFVVDTTGFGGSKLVPPAGWKLTSIQSFSEVFGYQGEVSVSEYDK